jgi:3-methyl-2-oxobutanoate hydroxymethyltransferase
MITAYDAAMAALAEEAGADILLVGDSVGMTLLGYSTTVPVTMDAMVHHAAAVVRGTSRAMVVADMPFLSCHVGEAEAVRNAGRFLQEAGAGAVKVEGGEALAPVVRQLVQAGIPVVGHVGLQPQTVLVQDGYRVQGRSETQAEQVKRDAVAIQAAGAFCVVLECIPATLAAEITAMLEIPTIGIGAGRNCDGQVQVMPDLLGLSGASTPRHAKQYADVATMIRDALRQYADEVRSGAFPGTEQSPK